MIPDTSSNPSFVPNTNIPDLPNSSPEQVVNLQQVSSYLSAEEVLIQQVPSYISQEEIPNADDSPNKIRTNLEHVISFISKGVFTTYNFKVDKDYISNLTTISPSNLEYIGEGQFKMAFKTYLLIKNKPVALVITKQSTENESVRKNELKMMLASAKASILGILPNYGILHDPVSGDYVVVTKFCNRGTLNESFSSILLQNDTKKALFLRQCFENLANLHQANISHRDIKTSNILIHFNSQSEFKCYLGDLGNALESNATLPFGMQSNLNVLPPFAFTNNHHGLANPKYDNWAYGLLICDLMRKRNPELAFDIDDQYVGNLAKSLPWLQFCLSTPDPEKVKQAEAAIDQFINETFDKAPLFSNKHMNHLLKQLVSDLMKINPQDILNDNTIMHRLTLLWLESRFGS